jgi:hypothetical protein
MGLMLSEPIEDVVEVPEILTAVYVEYAKTTQNAHRGFFFRLHSLSELPAGHLGYTYTTLICGAMEGPLHD